MTYRNQYILRFLYFKCFTIHFFRFIPLPERILHKVRSSVSAFNFQYPVFSFRPSSSFLLFFLSLLSFPVSLLQYRVLVTFSYAVWDQSSYPSVFLLFVGYSSLSWLFVILHFSYDRSNWSVPSFSATAFQNSPGIYDLLSEVTKFQCCTKLHSKCSNLLFSSLRLSPVCWWKESSSCWMMLLQCSASNQIQRRVHILIIFATASLPLG